MLVVKNLPANEGDAGSIPGSGGSLGGGNGNLLQYSHWENPTDRGNWGATTHGAAKSQTGLSTQNKLVLQNRVMGWRLKTWDNLPPGKSNNLPLITVFKCL